MQQNTYIQMSNAFQISHSGGQHNDFCDCMTALKHFKVPLWQMTLKSTYWSNLKTCLLCLGGNKPLSLSWHCPLPIPYSAEPPPLNLNDMPPLCRGLSHFGLGMGDLQQKGHRLILLVKEGDSRDPWVAHRAPYLPCAVYHEITSQEKSTVCGRLYLAQEVKQSLGSQRAIF